MAWLKIDADLLRHPKLRKFARGLGIPEAAAAGHLFALWGWAMTYAADGNLSGMGADDIAWAAGWTGDAQEFLTAAMQCGIRGTGFLEENERGEIVLHRWDEHMGDRFERREKEATRLREYRKKQSDPKAGDKPGDSVPSTYDVRTPYVHSTDDVRTAYVRGTYDVRGEEMKREENISPPISPPAGGGGFGRGPWLTNRSSLSGKQRAQCVTTLAVFVAL